MEDPGVTTTSCADVNIQLEIEDWQVDADGRPVPTDRDGRPANFTELFRPRGELVMLQDGVRHSRQKVVILFERRDAAGNGGVIKRTTQRLNPRVVRVAALPALNDPERTRWCVQSGRPAPAGVGRHGRARALTSSTASGGAVGAGANARLRRLNALGGRAR